MNKTSVCFIFTQLSNEWSDGGSVTLTLVHLFLQLCGQHRDWRRHQTLLLQSGHQEHSGTECTHFFGPIYFYMLEMELIGSTPGLCGGCQKMRITWQMETFDSNEAGKICRSPFWTLIFFGFSTNLFCSRTNFGFARRRDVQVTKQKNTCRKEYEAIFPCHSRVAARTVSQWEPIKF